MGRSPCCDKQLGLKKGPWTPEEDKVLVDYIQANGHGSWRSLPKLAGLQRCGKSCRLRWTNYLRPDIKRGPFTQDEQKSIIQLHGIVGNKWSTIATQLPGRTDNEIKNYWNTHLKKRLLRMGINPETYAPSHISPLSTPAPSTSSPASANATSSNFSAARHMAQWESARLEAEARLSRESLLFSAASAASIATTLASTNATDQTNIDDKGKKEPADFFLRMWNSDIGDSFRKKNESNCQLQIKVTEEESSPGVSSSCNTKPSSALTVSEANAERKEEVESEETSDETYQFYLDLAAGDDELSLFNQSHHRLESCYSSLFSSDLSELASLDNPFK